MHVHTHTHTHIPCNSPRFHTKQCQEAPGCGEWTRPMNRNPDYKGKWSAPMVDNPAYKGVWTPRQIRE
jgi:hypothetical protein